MTSTLIDTSNKKRVRISHRDLSKQFFSACRSLENTQEHIKIDKIPDPEKLTVFGQVDRLLNEMELIEKRHKLEQSEDVESKTNWN